MKLETAYQVFNEIKRSIKNLENSNGYLSDEFEYNCNDAEEKYMYNISRSIVDRLDAVQTLLNWIEKPVIAIGRLTSNQNKRYEVGGKELTSGHPIDVWDDEWDEWVYSRVEHNGHDYYIVSFGRDEKIEGMSVRLRQ
ncbi:DUF5348 domain-containing protein [Bacillus timonensis]|uniref:DUF5348 domain-containing protein n=1 Tax=Bacillus timonensis TaxID=1033734 RepID=UPI000287D7C4|nr:DUF5348 domain-containing protein [Bacillus timonensis]